MILKSKKNKNYVLKIGDPAGMAILEINGYTHHLNKPYLQIKYLAKKTSSLSAGYDVQGWFFGYFETGITTNKLLRVLHGLGFSMTSNTLREEITKELGEKDSNIDEDQDANHSDVA